MQVILALRRYEGYDYSMRKDPAKFRQCLIDKLENGEWPFSVPMGYKKGPYRVIERQFNDQDFGYRIKPVMVRDIIVDDNAKEFVLSVFARYVSGSYSMHSLCREIKAEKTGYPVSSTGLHHILLNQFYTGEMPFEGTLYPHNYPKLISQDVFDRCQELLKSKSTGGKNGKSKSSVRGLPVFLYSKMIQCSICEGTNLSPERQKGIVYYKCGSKFRRFNEDVNRKHLAKYLREDRISECFVKALDDIEKIKLDKFVEFLPHAPKANLLFFKDHCKTWFVTNHDIKNKLVKILFKDLSYDGSSLIFSIKSPFNGENFQDYRNDDICGVISRMGYPVVAEEEAGLSKDSLQGMVDEIKQLIISQGLHNHIKPSHVKTVLNDITNEVVQKFEVQPPRVPPSDDFELSKKILKLCVKPISHDNLIEKLGMSLTELQNALFDLQVDGRIEQDDLGYWRVK